MRSLAEQSKQATIHVKEIILQIQKATNPTVMATVEGTKGEERRGTWQRGTGGDRAAGAGNSSVGAGSGAGAGGQPAAARGRGADCLAMQNINQATTQNLASTRQAGQSAENLNEVPNGCTC